MENQSPNSNANQSPAPSTSPSPQPLYNPGFTYPVATEVAKKLVSGDSPLDFIKKNIAAREPQSIIPEQALAAEEEKRAATFVEETPKAEEPLPSTPSEEPKVEESKEPEVEAASTPEPEVSSEPEDKPTTIAANFKNVRKILNETKTQLVTKEKELQTTKEELEKFKSGEVLPDVIQKKEAEIARLSKYEKIVSLKTSPEYQDKFVKPLTTISEQLTAIANDYKIPPQKLLSAVNIRNQADLNRFLTSHLDDGGFLEVKQLIKQAQTIQDQARAAEVEPASALQQLIESGKQAKLQKMTAQRESLKSTTRGVWDEAYNEVKEEGKAIELIFKEDDPEHNKNYVEPIVKQAASEFGKIINQLADNGLEKLPRDLGHALAKAVLLAHASAVSLETRSEAVNQANELLRQQERTNRLYRPPAGYTSPGKETAPVDQTSHVTPTQAGRSLINNVLASRRK